MQPFKNILVIEDPDQQHPFALKRAISLAEQFDAQVELFACPQQRSMPKTKG